MLEASDEEDGFVPTSNVMARENRLEQTIAELETEIADLRAVEAELRAMFHAMTDLVIVLDCDGTYLKIAPTAQQVLYKSPDELLGHTLHEVFPREKAHFLLTKIREALQERRVIWVEYSLNIRGEERFFQGNLSPMSEDTVVLVVRDVTQLKLAALRENELKEAIIRAKDAALDELSTPLVPITDEIVAMPLIGQLDERRMERVMTTLLQGVQSKHTRYAILDVTGVLVVNTEVARAIMAVARAAQLLGAHVILTGIRADVARALAAMDTEFGTVVTRSTLKDGIAFAMRAGAGAGKTSAISGQTPRVRQSTR